MPRRPGDLPEQGVEEADRIAAEDDVRGGGRSSRIHPAHAAADLPPRQQTLNIEPGYLVRDQLILLRLIKDASRSVRLPVDGGGGAGLTDAMAPYCCLKDSCKNWWRIRYRFAATPRISGLYLDLDDEDPLGQRLPRSQGLIKEGELDRPCFFRIPYTYAFTGAILAEALRARGDEQSANRIMKGFVKS